MGYTYGAQTWIWYKHSITCYNQRNPWYISKHWYIPGPGISLIYAKTRKLINCDGVKIPDYVLWLAVRTCAVDQPGRCGRHVGAARQPDQLQGHHCCLRAGNRSLPSPTSAATAESGADQHRRRAPTVPAHRLHGRGGAARRPGRCAGGQNCALLVARRRLPLGASLAGPGGGCSPGPSTPGRPTLSLSLVGGSKSSQLSALGREANGDSHRIFCTLRCPYMARITSRDNKTFRIAWNARPSLFSGTRSVLARARRVDTPGGSNRSPHHCHQDKNSRK